MVDGIFAIAMTILVLGINPPKPDISQAQEVLPNQIFDIIPGNLYFYYRFFDSCRVLAGSSPPVSFRPHRRFPFALD